MKKNVFFCQTEGSHKNDSDDEDSNYGNIVQMGMSHKLRVLVAYYVCNRAPAIEDQTFDGKRFAFFYAAKFEWARGPSYTKQTTAFRFR